MHRASMTGMKLLTTEWLIQCLIHATKIGNDSEYVFVPAEVLVGYFFPPVLHASTSSVIMWIVSSVISTAVARVTICNNWM